METTKLLEREDRVKRDKCVTNGYSGNVPRFVLKSWWVVAALIVVCSLIYWLDACSLIIAVSYMRLPGSLPSEGEVPVNPGFLVDTEGCRIPVLDAFDTHVLKFLKKEKPINCGENLPPPLVTSNNTALLLNASLASHYNTTEEELRCCYRPYWRSPGGDDSYIFSKNCTVFEDDVVVDEDFVKVECWAEGGRQVYKDFHAFVRRKPAVEQRCAEAAPRDRVSVLVVGVDAVSRLNLHRHMPRTLALMRELKAIEMLGYNKVGDNTFPNIVPVLSGLSEDELRRTCWLKSSDFFDKCPWIWNNFSAAGYRTVFGEDAAWMGIFTYVKKGFKRQPTDYYTRTYQHVAEKEIGHHKLWNAELCVGTQLTLQVFLGYMSKFITTMSSAASFAFFWTASLTHDYLNFPQLGDEHYENFFRRHLQSGELNRTVIVFMSDHGIRWGDIRETYQGRLEERLPFLIFAFPQGFADRYGAAVANMRRNARRLTTPFDLHETLRDLLDLRLLEDDRVKRRSAAALGVVARGKSLFLPGSENRTCKDAGVDQHWCTCQTSEPLNVTDEKALVASAVVVHHLNALLDKYGECETLELAEVRTAQRQMPTSYLQQSHAVTDYVLVVRTRPGDALFEATVRQRAGSNSMSVEGTVSRINTYGDQSACVAEYHMKLYCYCKSYLANNAVS